MLGHGNTVAVVADAHAGVGVNGYLDAVAAPGQGFVDRVIDDLVGQVVERLDVGAADIHAGAAAHSFQTLEYLDIPGVVVCGRQGFLLFGLTGHRSTFKDEG